jgi:phage tail sheath protein FI
MPTHKTPGVYVEEISKLPPSVTPVATAIPVFIGYTEKAEEEDGSSLKNKPKRISSLLEYEKFFGSAPVEEPELEITQDFDKASGQITKTKIEFAKVPTAKPHYLYYSMQIYFANGGGPCWICSVGKSELIPNATKVAFTNAINILQAYDEPTLLLFPDSCLLSDADHGKVVAAALSHCSKMQDRFTIIDVCDAIDGGTDDNDDVTSRFRNKVPGDIALTKYGAAYFPYLRTSLLYRTEDSKIKIKRHAFNPTGTGAGTPLAAITAGTSIDDAKVKDENNALYNAIKTFLATSRDARVTLPPSAAIAGAYARVDRTRGVFKTPANVSLLEVIEPAVAVTNDLNDGLNVDANTGKSVNAIRAFEGKGTMVWGARTLAGNDNESRYVPVRRFLIFAEESIKKATGAFVFEPNDANTWMKVRSMIESFLTVQWRDGALAGTKPEHAFYVKVGLNETMSTQDILDGCMIVEIGLAIVRPAEFIVLRFAQKMQES